MNLSSNIRFNSNADLIIIIVYYSSVYKTLKYREEDCRWLIKNCINNSKTLNKHL